MSKGKAPTPEHIAAARQQYLAGMSYEQIAKSSGLGLRSLKRYGKREKWEQERRAIDSNRPGTDLALLVSSADTRVQSVHKHWAEVLAGLICKTTNLADRAADELGKADLTTLDPREQATFLKLLTDAMARQADVAGQCRPDVPPLQLPTGEEARAILDRLAGVKNPRIQETPQVTINVVTAPASIVDNIDELIPTVNRVEHGDATALQRGTKKWP